MTLVILAIERSTPECFSNHSYRNSEFVLQLAKKVRRAPGVIAYYIAIVGLS